MPDGAQAVPTESGRRREEVSLERARRSSPDPGDRGMDLSRIRRKARTPPGCDDEEKPRADGHTESPPVVEHFPGLEKSAIRDTVPPGAMILSWVL